MASKTQDQRLAFEAMVRANAVSYSIQLFIGRGQFERAEADTLGEAISIGKAMKEAHPTCHAQPIYYAIEPSGHSTTITPAQFTESTNMIKTAVTTETAATNVVNRLFAERARTNEDRRKKNAERMRATRAAKAQNRADEVAKTMEGQTAALKASKPAFPSADETMVHCEALTGVAENIDRGCQIGAQSAWHQEADAIVESTVAPVKSGLCPTRGEALVEGRKVYGATAMVGDDFVCKKTARGEWYWGPVEAAKEPTPARGARKTAKAAPAVADKSAKTPKSGSDADVILRFLTRDEGMTKAEVEAELEALRGRHVKISPRSTAARVAQAKCLKLVEKKDADGSDRFFLAAKGA